MDLLETCACDSALENAVVLLCIHVQRLLVYGTLVVDLVHRRVEFTGIVLGLRGLLDVLGVLGPVLHVEAMRRLWDGGGSGRRMRRGMAGWVLRVDLGGLGRLLLRRRRGLLLWLLRVELVVGDWEGRVVSAVFLCVLAVQSRLLTVVVVRRGGEQLIDVLHGDWPCSSSTHKLPAPATLTRDRSPTRQTLIRKVWRRVWPLPRLGRCLGKLLSRLGRTPIGTDRRRASLQPPRRPPWQKQSCQSQRVLCRQSTDTLPRKSLKVAELKEILIKSQIPLGKANKADLVQKILDSPAALQVYAELHPDPAAAAPVTAAPVHNAPPAAPKQVSASSSSLCTRLTRVQVAPPPAEYVLASVLGHRL